MAGKKVGIALGAGAARGWAHIGVLRALDEAGISPRVVAGSSIGALVGAFYAAGKLDALEEEVLALPEKGAWFYDFSLTARGGFVQGDKVSAFMRDVIGDVSIESLDTSFVAIAAALDSGREKRLDSGSLVEAVRASIALPGLMTPVQVNGTWLSDGGLVNPVPVTACREAGADVVVAVLLEGRIVPKEPPETPSAEEEEGESLWTSLSEDFEALTQSLKARFLEPVGDQPGLFTVLARSIDIVVQRLTEAQLEQDGPDILLRPDVGDMHLLQFDRGEMCIAAGRQAVDEADEALRRIVVRGSTEDAEERRGTQKM